MQRSQDGVLVKIKFNSEQETLNSGFNKIEVYFSLTSKSECKECKAAMVLHKGFKDTGFHQLKILSRAQTDRVPGHHIPVPGCRILRGKETKD